MNGPPLPWRSGALKAFKTLRDGPAILRNDRGGKALAAELKGPLESASSSPRDMLDHPHDDDTRCTQEIQGRATL